MFFVICSVFGASISGIQLDYFKLAVNARCRCRQWYPEHLLSSIKFVKYPVYTNGQKYLWFEIMKHIGVPIWYLLYRIFKQFFFVQLEDLSFFIKEFCNCLDLDPVLRSRKYFLRLRLREDVNPIYASGFSAYTNICHKYLCR